MHAHQQQPLGAINVSLVIVDEDVNQFAAYRIISENLISAKGCNKEPQLAIDGKP